MPWQGLRRQGLQLGLRAHPIGLGVQAKARAKAGAIEVATVTE